MNVENTGHLASMEENALDAGHNASNTGRLVLYGTCDNPICWLIVDEIYMHQNKNKYHSIVYTFASIFIYNIIDRWFNWDDGFRMLVLCGGISIVCVCFWCASS